MNFYFHVERYTEGDFTDTFTHIIVSNLESIIVPGDYSEVITISPETVEGFLRYWVLLNCSHDDEDFALATADYCKLKAWLISCHQEGVGYKKELSDTLKLFKSELFSHCDNLWRAGKL